jgi:hypothetical protein
MTILWADGFDHYGSVVGYLTQGPYASVSQTTLSTANPGPRTGLRCARIGGGFDVGLRRIFGGEVDVAGVGFAFILPSLPTNDSSVALAGFATTGNLPLVTVLVGSTGQIILRNGGNAGAVIAQGDPCVLSGSYQHFEVRAEIEDSEASVEVRVNGVTRLSVVGLAIAQGGKAAQVSIGAVGQGVFGFPAYMGVDDLFAWSDVSGGSADFLGDKKVYTRFPASDGPIQDWVPSVGSDGYEMLNNNPPVDGTDFLTAALLGSSGVDRSEFGIAPFPAEVVSVAGIVIATRLFKTDAGNAKVVVGVASGGSEEIGEEHALSTAPTWYHDVFETDPDTGTVWTVPAVNALTETLERIE